MKYTKAVCPVDDFDREWIDKTLIWFEQKLGKEFIKNKEYLIPSNCRFEYQYFNSHEAIQYFIEFICAYIDFDSSLIEFHLFWNDTTESLEGFDSDIEKPNYIQDYKYNIEGRYEIVIEENTLNDFDGTFLSLVYKLTYLKLTHQKVFTFENVYMVNFSMLLHGFGILMANTFVRTAQWRGLGYSAWRVKRIGLLNHRVYGYLFAVLSAYRDEKDQAFQNYLCNDVQQFYMQACRFLQEQSENGKPNPTPNYVKDEEVFFEKFYYKNRDGIRLIAHMLEDRYEGLATFYHKNGTLWSERIYKKDIPYTVLSNYNSFEEPVEKGTLFEGNGTLYIYNPDGNLNRIEEYLNGNKIK